MKHLILLASIAALLILANSCSNTGFTVKAKINNMPEQGYTLELIGATPQDTKIIDSGRTAADGSFTLNGEGVEPYLYRIRFEQSKYILLTLDNDKAELNADWAKLEDYVVTGSKGSVTLKTFLVALREHIRDINSLDYVTKNINHIKNKDSALQVIDQQLKAMNSSYVQYVKQFADTTTYAANAVFAANIISPSKEAAWLQQFYTQLPRRYPNSSMAKDFSEIYKSKLTTNTNNSSADTAKNKATTYKPSPADAQPATEISMPTPQGNVVSLSSLKGKYVLVDFWASWCGPCRQENPNVVAAFNQYKNKNFTVLGVSLDDNKDAWQQAIQNDGLTWTHISDLKKWGSSVVRSYSLNGIPSNVLVDPNGNIIARDLRGPALISALAQVLQ
jgi:peroxiredoxin